LGYAVSARIIPQRIGRELTLPEISVLELGYQAWADTGEHQHGFVHSWDFEINEPRAAHGTNELCILAEIEGRKTGDSSLSQVFKNDVCFGEA